MKSIAALLRNRLTALALWLLLPASAVQAQAPLPSPAWQKAMTVGQARGAGVKLEAIAADTLGNVYVTGSFVGTVQFGHTILKAGAGGLTFVAKWDDAAQRYCWAVPVGPASAVFIYNLAASGGAVYVIGGIERTVRLADTTLTKEGGSFFIGKLVDKGTSGQLVWVQPVVDVSGEGAVPHALVVRGTSVYVAGDFNGTTRLGGTTLHCNGNRSLFVAKLLDAGRRGRFVWARQSTGSGVVTRPALAVAGARVYVTGNYVGTVVFGTDSVTCPRQEDRVLVAKLLDTGPTATVGWVKQLEIGQGNLNAMVATGDSVYVAGLINRYVQLHPTDDYPTSLESLFIARLKDEGATVRMVWKTQFDNDQPAGDIYVMNIALHGSALYLTGQISGTANFGSVQLHAASPTNFFLGRAYESPAGATFNWVQRLGGKEKVSVTSNALGLLAIASTGTLYLGVTLGAAATIGSQPLLPKPTAKFADYLVLFRLPQ